MKESTIAVSFLDSLPPEWQTDLLPSIQQELGRSSYKIVVLDDDPTGTQTVQDIPVLTTWSVDALEAELRGEFPAFFILTNSRSLTQQAATPSPTNNNWRKPLNSWLLDSTCRYWQREGISIKIVSKMSFIIMRPPKLSILQIPK